MSLTLKKCAADRLSPHQYLMLELLAAYHLTGEREIVLPTMTVAVAKGLEAQGLVSWRSTDDGIAVAMTAMGIRMVGCEE